MADRTDEQRAMSDYVQWRLRTELDAGERGLAERIAEKIDLSTAQLSNLKNGRTRAAMGSAAKLAKWWGVELPQLLTLAVEWAQQQPAKLAPVVDLDEERRMTPFERVKRGFLYRNSSKSVRDAYDALGAAFTGGKKGDPDDDYWTKKLLGLREDDRLMGDPLPGTRPDDD